ncbi:hypothetical protein FRB91_000457 [Serendipita sp. 411]|nr:hypothetical protein FRB91_000457 [Serendipita sp. 411]
MTRIPSFLPLLLSVSSDPVLHRTTRDNGGNIPLRESAVSGTGPGGIHRLDVAYPDVRTKSTAAPTLSSSPTSVSPLQINKENQPNTGRPNHGSMALHIHGRNYVRRFSSSGLRSAPWGNDHTHSEQDDSKEEADKRAPVDDQVIVELSPLSTSTYQNGSGVNETYWLIGGSGSVSTVLNLLLEVKADPGSIDDCGILNYTLLPLNSTTSSVSFSNATQWYHLPSFALAYEVRGNLSVPPPFNETTGTILSGSKSFSDHQAPPLFYCLNNTITAVLSTSKEDNSTVATVGIASIVLFTILCLVCALCCCLSRCIREVTPCVRERRLNRRGYTDRTYSQSSGLYDPDSPVLPLRGRSQSPLGISRVNTPLEGRYYSHSDYDSRRSLTPVRLFPRNEGGRNRRWSRSSIVRSIGIPPLAHIHRA